MLKYNSFTTQTPELLLKKITFFSPSIIKISGKSVSFGDKKIKKVIFTKTRKYLK